MKKQKGFGIIEVLVVLALIGIVGFASYMIWNNEQSNNSAYNSDNNGCCEESIGPNGVKIIEQWCIDENYEGGPACIPAHYTDLKVGVSEENECQKIGGFYEQVYVGGVAGSDNLCLVEKQ